MLKLKESVPASQCLQGMTVPYKLRNTSCSDFAASAAQAFGAIELKILMSLIEKVCNFTVAEAINTQITAQ